MLSRGLRLTRLDAVEGKGFLEGENRDFQLIVGRLFCGNALQRESGPHDKAEDSPPAPRRG